MTWLLLFAGLFSIGGAVSDWDWFMNNSRARFFVQVFGRNGARVFYVLLGLGLVAVSGGQLLGLLPELGR